jgi:alpha-tubulin suppressor-like RCC1 family protein
LDSPDKLLNSSLKDGQGVKQMCAGGHHSLILTNEGRVYSFGYGSHGQLGLRNTQNYFLPQLVVDLKDTKVEFIAAGWNHSAVLTTEGYLYVCGHGEYGQLGLGDTSSKTRFTYVPFIKDKNIYKVFAGGNHTWLVIDEVQIIRENWVSPRHSEIKDAFEDNKSVDIETDSNKRSTYNYDKFQDEFAEKQS